MATSYSEAREEITEYYNLQWASLVTDPEVPVLSPNSPTPSKPDDISLASQFLNPLSYAWSRLTVMHNTLPSSTFGPVGGRRFNRSGTIFVNLFTLPQFGEQDSDDLVDIAVSILEGKQVNNIWFLNCRPNTIGVYEGWYQQNVICDFKFEVRK